MAAVSAMMIPAAATGLCKLTESVSSKSACAMKTPSLSGSRTGVMQATRSRTVRCMAEPEESKPEAGPATPPTPPPVSTLPVMPPSPKQPKVSTKFGDVFAFSGPAPETINGRLAMLGFVTALGVELATGEDLVSQINMGGIQWFIVTAGLFTAASLIPMFKGVSVDMKSKEVFSSTAEKWNGRMAMMGLVALAVTEYVKGSPLV